MPTPKNPVRPVRPDGNHPTKREKKHPRLPIFHEYRATLQLRTFGKLGEEAVGVKRLNGFYDYTRHKRFEDAF